MAVAAGMLFPSTARAATTYDVQFGADFFEFGVPAFSLRAYPTSVKLMKGDTIRFYGFGGPVLLPAGEVPQEWTEQHNTFLGDDWLQLLPDADDGPDATKFNTAYFFTEECAGTVDAPCEYQGNGTDPYIPPETETGDVYVTINANPGDVVWGFVGAGVSPLRIEVVSDQADASTQAELDARADEQWAQDFETALSTHERYSSKQTWHRDADGHKVHDAWGGLSRGPIEFLAMYPKTLKIKKGDRVMWHFGDLQNELHTVAVPTSAGLEAAAQSFMPSCDPDGDDGPGPDTPPNFEAETDEELCPDISQLEFEMNPDEIFGTGNGTYNGKANDLELSGIKGHESYQDSLLNDDPWELKFSAPSGKKGYKYFCTIHGRSMGGKVIVKA
jgi:plastocyanin